MNDLDEQWMRAALKEAEQSASRGEVPVGAVPMTNNTMIGAAGNSPIHTSDPTGHAEIIALRQGGLAMGNYRLPGTTLYVTLEPCVMCMGAIILARVDRLVYGADDPKTGAVVSKYSIGMDNQLNHSIEITGGILKDECARLLKTFFAARRKKSG